MSGTFNAHFEILPPAQRHVWALLQPLSQLGFVLYGGTAIALRLGHRVSVDFDWFSEQPLDREKLHTVLPELTRAEVLQDALDTLTVLVTSPDGADAHVKVSFFGGVPFGRVGEPNACGEAGPQVASLDDLMATKVKTILQRIEARDYRDLAAMISAGASLPKALAAAKLFYGNAFQPSECLKAMVYFEGGDLHTLGGHEKTLLIRAASEVLDLSHVERASYQLATTQGAS